MTKTIFIALLALLAGAGATVAKAAPTTILYSLNKEKKLHGIIAQGVANRIEFGLIGFREIIGDQSKYRFITDENAKSIFLTPKVPAGEHIALSLVNQAGEIVDLNLEVKKVDGQVIKIDKKISELESSRDSDTREAKLMIKAMQKDIDSNGKYYVLNEPRTLPGLNTLLHPEESTTLVQDRTYRYGNLIGSRVMVKNSSKNLKELQIADFKNLFEDPLAISFQKKVLRPKENGFVYIIAKEKAND